MTKKWCWRVELASADALMSYPDLCISQQKITKLTTRCRLQNNTMGCFVNTPIVLFTSITMHITPFQIGCIASHPRVLYLHPFTPYLSYSVLGKRVEINEWLRSKGFRFWRKTDEMTKTGRRDENVDFWRNWRNSGFVANFLTKFALFDQRKWHFWPQNLA